MTLANRSLRGMSFCVRAGYEIVRAIANATRVSERVPSRLLNSVQVVGCSRDLARFDMDVQSTPQFSVSDGAVGHYRERFICQREAL